MRMVTLQNCLDALRGGRKSCTETCSTASGDGKQFVFVNDDDDTVIKQQKDREPMTSTTIKNDPLVSCMSLCVDCYARCACIDCCLSVHLSPLKFGLVTSFLTLVMKLCQEYSIVCKHVFPFVVTLF